VAVTSPPADRITIVDVRRARVVARPAVSGSPHDVSFARDGHALWVSAERAGRVVKLSVPGGRRVFQRRTAAAPHDLRVSPDGRRVAVRLGRDIWLLERNQGALTRLSFDSSASRPAWSVDGRRVAYIRQIGTRQDLRLVGSDGGSPAESLLALPDLQLWEGLFTPDGRSLVVRTVGGRGSRDIWLVPLDPAGPPVPLLKSPADEMAPAVSPDGRWLAYVSNESGRAEVYARSFPSMAGRYQVSLDGGTEPAWSPRGGELFYRNGPAMIAAQLRTDAAVEVLRRTTLFSEPDYATDLTHRLYDVTPDGDHFVLVRTPDGASRLTVTLNRFHHLRNE
jgi:Tol biopolymer transport system component